jgi:hypothetical protein
MTVILYIASSNYQWLMGLYETLFSLFSMLKLLGF